jgi:adenosylmethionine-8-amino-7-oxononanoate aminotransferase
MPFTPNRQFKAIAAPVRIGAKACTTPPKTAASARRIAGLWCVNAGHRRREIAQAT